MAWWRTFIPCQTIAEILGDSLNKISIYSLFGEVARGSVLLDFSLTVKAATLIFISGRGSAISSAKEGKSGFIYNLVKS